MYYTYQDHITNSVTQNFTPLTFLQFIDMSWEVFAKDKGALK